MSDHEPNTHPSEEMEEAGRDDVVRVSDDVIAMIAGTVLSEVKGVASSAPGFVGGLLGRKGASKGIKIEADGDEVVVDVTIAVEYGARIPDVAAEIQTRLRSAIEEMTGKFVRAVNVTVQGIRAPSGAPDLIEPIEEGGEVQSEEEPRQEE